MFIKLQLFQMKLATTTSEEVVEFLSGGELWGNGGTAALLSRMPSPSHWLEVVVVELEVEQHFLPSREALPFLQQVTMYCKQVEDIELRESNVRHGMAAVNNLPQSRSMLLRYIEL